MCNFNLGYYQEDSPSQLVDHVLNHMKLNQKDLDIIILNGDFVAHNLNIQNNNTPIDDAFKNWKQAQKVVLNNAF